MRHNILRAEVVQHANEHTNKLASTRFKIPESTVSRWVREAKVGKKASKPRGTLMNVAELTI